jgi:hypothetical protein
MFDPQTLAQTLLLQHPALVQKICKATLASASDAEHGLTETLKFLALANENSASECSPSQRVDLVWHEFILFTRLYANFCQQNFGKYIHHEPSADGKACSSTYQHTLDLYRQRFGAPDPDWWSVNEKEPADCGMCDAH